MINEIKPYQEMFEYYSPTKIVFGVGSLKTMHTYTLPGKKALIVIDKDPFTKNLGYLDALIHELTLAGCEQAVFDQVTPNPVLPTVRLGVELCKEEGCDFIVTLGGGSCHDVGKAISMVVSNGGDAWDYIIGGTGGAKSIDKDTMPIITISTTAGTGSETSKGLVLTNEETEEKNSLKSPKLFATYTFIDMELQTSVPAKLTAFQGYDAMSHCIEGYLCKRSTMFSDMIALTCIENVSAYLSCAVNKGQDLKAREHVAFGSVLSGLSMACNTVSILHPLEQALSSYYPKLAHGAGLIMLSSAYHRHMIEHHVCDDRYIRLARAMGSHNANTPMDFLKVHDSFIENIGCGSLKMVLSRVS